MLFIVACGSLKHTTVHVFVHFSSAYKASVWSHLSACITDMKMLPSVPAAPYLIFFLKRALYLYIIS